MAVSAPITLRIPIKSELAEQLRKAGPGTTIHHPRAGKRKGRAVLMRALTKAGVPIRLVKTFAWSTAGAQPVAAAEPTEPEVIEATAELADSELEADG